MNEAKQLLTHSRLACFRTCPRKHYIRYELGLRPETDSYALRVGSAFHAALEAIDSGQDVEAVLADRMPDPYDMAVVAAMVNGHEAYWANDPLEAVATELPFQMALRNPVSGSPTPVWDLAGKIDRIVRLQDGRLALMEYKTTSRDLGPGADYWIRLHMDQQLSMYVLAARELGFDVQTILYDVTRRPGLRPLKATPEESRKYTKDGRLYAAQREVDETPEEFARRLGSDIAERPSHYYARIEIARLDQDLESCARELWVQQLTIRSAQRWNHWYRNPGACFDPLPCEYLHVCQNVDLEVSTPPGFVRSDVVHPELSGTATPEASPACPASRLVDAL